MKIKKIWILGMATMALTFMMVFAGCGSSPSSTRSGTSGASGTPAHNVPDIDYSRVGPEDSVILAYLDPSLVRRINMQDTNAMLALANEMVTVYITVGTEFNSAAMVGIIYYNAPAGLTMPSFNQSFQMQIPNGTHTITVRGSRGMGGDFDILPFEAAFDNDAVTYKVRLASDDEKRAGGIGLGNEVYVMEEVAQRKLR